ncbi:MAG: signal recognition particle protein [Oscillospiraceae bacterium]
MAFEGLAEKLGAAFKGLKSKGKLSESDIKNAMREVRVALLEADVNYKIAKDFVKVVSEKSLGQDVLTSLIPSQQVIKIVKDELVELMGKNVERIKIPSKPPCIIMMCGLQGSGKTTHSGKLAKMLKKDGHRPLLVAADIYRPAAIEQLKVIGESISVPVFSMGEENPVLICKNALSHAKDYGYDIVILDTAGRLHIDDDLMKELENVKEAVKPNEILLVIDSMTGQDAVNVAESFNNLLEIDGVILTKLDGDTRGGAAISVRAVTGKPIKFIGTGEKLDDLEQFHPDRMASRILGMGDVLSLIEKAQDNYDEKEVEKLEKKIKQNKFDLNDMLSQFEQLDKMGSIQQILGMLPGNLGNKISESDIDERQLHRVKAIIRSMTTQEREVPKIINAQRKRRIAKGSGVEVQEVNKVLKQFEQTSKMIKQMTGFNSKGKRKKLPFNFPM